MIEIDLSKKQEPCAVPKQIQQICCTGNLGRRGNITNSFII